MLKSMGGNVTHSPASSVSEGPEREHLDNLLLRFETTGCIVTSSHLALLSGSFVSFITPCSVEPPRFLVCTRNDTLLNEVIEKSHVLAIHLLASDQEGWIQQFAGAYGRDAEKFADVRWRTGVTGAPILEDAAGYIEGEVLHSIPCGDHTARLVDPVGAVLRDPDAELLTMREIVARGLV
jgi:flavin reductase (DIM6/NTAB) family NADH-FMN oxidoreductase RutF